ncbi:MAG: threonine-phosphate decarboxylase CobD [Cyanobacteria bacterium J06621_8]
MDRPRHGGNLTWAASIASCPVTALTDFSASINPLGTPSRVLAAIIDGTSQLAAYPDPEYRELRSQLGQHHQLPPEFILPGNGSAELLTWAGRELAQQKFTYLITPAFRDYQRALEAFDGSIRACPLSLSLHQEQDQPTLDLPLPQSPAAESGLLLNNPHNPTGKLWTKDEIEPYLLQFSLVVIDEAFMDFLTPSQSQSLISLVPDYPNLVILRSLTKFYSLPGLRIGYAIAHPSRIARWRSWRDPWSVNTLAVVAAIAAIQDQEFQQQTWDWLLTARPQLKEQLRAISGLMPFDGAANYLLVKSDYSVSWLQEQLLKQDQLLIRDCLSFPELGDRFFRIAVRLPADNQRLVTAITRIIEQ